MPNGSRTDCIHSDCFTKPVHPFHFMFRPDRSFLLIRFHVFVLFKASNGPLQTPVSRTLINSLFFLFMHKPWTGRF
ncbi:hypothetical protein XELAEV_18039136mg [Xenopus laevis]|uniref:Uncharacterized protein n=1 Tax=Xenopus laevis TaxID=8355 RepID=A0A974H7K0_XENLA|nr:hypothetical protein XELAEV_18039136mg [Xenopus laevis]